MNNETFETIQELRNYGVKWGDVYKKYNLNFKSVKAMVRSYTMEEARRRTT